MTNTITLYKWVNIKNKHGKIQWTLGINSTVQLDNWIIYKVEINPTNTILNLLNEHSTLFIADDIVSAEIYKP